MPTEEKTNWRQKTGRHRAHKHETGSPLALHPASRCNRIVPRMFLVAHIDFKATFSLLCRSSLLFHTDVLVCTLILVNGLGLGPKDPVQLAVCLLLCFKSCVVKLDLFFVRFLSRLINQRLMEEQSQVEELQKNLQEQGSKADDVSKRYISHIC